MPKHALYYFTQASVARALPSHELQSLAAQHGLHGTTFPTVAEATQAAFAEADQADFIYVGGSSFIVADLLADWKKIKD
jgi:dihydrofolate synthase/folylpolyglutamate synthase